MNIRKWWAGQKALYTSVPFTGTPAKPTARCRTSAAVAAVLLHRPNGEIIGNIAANRHWDFLPVGTWTEAMDLILTQRVGVLIVEGDRRGTDTKERLFLLQRQSHCFIVILTNPLLLRYWATFVNEPQFSVLATPVVDADLVKTVEEGWSVWKRLLITKDVTYEV